MVYFLLKKYPKNKKIGHFLAIFAENLRTKWKSFGEIRTKLACPNKKGIDDYVDAPFF